MKYSRKAFLVHTRMSLPNQMAEAALHAATEMVRTNNNKEWPHLIENFRWKEDRGALDGEQPCSCVGCAGGERRSPLGAHGGWVCTLTVSLLSAGRKVTCTLQRRELDILLTNMLSNPWHPCNNFQKKKHHLASPLLWKSLQSRAAGIVCH